MEIWKSVKIGGKETIWEASSGGRFRSVDRVGKITGKLIKGVILKQFVGDCGYLSVGLSRRTFRSHRIIAKLFIENPENKPEVNHINGIKTDNRVENLEWCTKSENARHAIKIGKKKTVLSEADVLFIRENYREMGSAKLAKMFNVSRGHIALVATHETWGMIESPVYQTKAMGAKKPIYQLSVNGDVLKMHLSIMDAARELEMQRTCIEKVLRGIRKTARGFKFSYVDYRNYKTPPVKIKKDKPDKVFCYNQNGDLVASFKTQRQAASILKIDRKGIYKCVKGKIKKYAGYTFAVKDNT